LSWFFNLNKRLFTYALISAPFPCLKSWLGDYVFLVKVALSVVFLGVFQ